MILADIQETHFQIPVLASANHLILLIGEDIFEEELAKQQKAKALAILEIAAATSIKRQTPASEKEEKLLQQAYALYLNRQIDEQIWGQIKALFVYYGAAKDKKNCLLLDSLVFPESWTSEQDLHFAKRLLPKFLQYKLQDYGDLNRGVNKILQDFSEKQKALEAPKTTKEQSDTGTDKMSQEDQELANWDKIKDSLEPEDFSNHLYRFPRGACEKLALDKLEETWWTELEKNPEYKDLKEFTKQFSKSGYAALALRQIVELEKREAEHWTAIKNAERFEALEKFMADWPEGPHYRQAQQRIEYLKKLPMRRKMLKGLAAAGFIGAIGGYNMFKHVLQDGSSLTMQGHIDTVNSVAISPNGKLIASGSSDKTVVLWNAETGEKLHSLKGHQLEVSSVGFSPDGKFLVSSSLDGTIKMWDSANGQLLHSFEGHKNWVTSVAVSPDGQTILSAGHDKVLRLWDIKNRQQIRIFSGHEDYVLSAVYSPTGKTVLSGGHDKTVRLWDVNSGKLLKVFSGHTDWVTSVAYSPTENIIISGSFDKTVKIWDLENGGEIAKISGYNPSSIISVAFSPNGYHIIAGGYDKVVNVWDVKTKKQITTLKGHNATSIHSVSISPNGKFLISGSADNTLKIWNMARL